jgi:hypothetical protein
MVMPKSKRRVRNLILRAAVGVGRDEEPKRVNPGEDFVICLPFEQRSCTL